VSGPILRIKSKHTLDGLHRHGANHRSDFLVLKVDRRDDGLFGLAFSIGRRKIRRAVSRNRLRRLVREWMLINRHRLVAGHDLLFLALRDPEVRRLKDLQPTLESLFSKAGLIRREATV
jgi:ribonuclease P protein component